MRRSLSGSAQPGRDRQRSVGLGPLALYTVGR